MKTTKLMIALVIFCLSLGDRATAQFGSRFEWAYITAVQTSGNDRALVFRDRPRQLWILELGVGCFGLWRNNGEWGQVESPGLFAGVGSSFHIDGQDCRIWNSHQMELAP